MSTSEKIRDNLLLKGLGKPVALNAIDWKIKQQKPSASPSEVQNETLEVIRSLVDDGLFRLGALDKHRFVASKRSLDHSLHKISHRYVDHYDDPKGWMFSAWMKLTDKGEQLARSVEKKAIDSHRGNRVARERAEHEVKQGLSTGDLAELMQLRAEVAELRMERDIFQRSVA
jgi:hypothetical protein